jgi:serine O-acetyltransferase
MKYDGDTIKAWAGDSQWRAWRADVARFRRHGGAALTSEGLWVLALYRMRRSSRNWRPRVLWLPVRLILKFVDRVQRLLTHISLDPEADIGPGTYIPHLGPIYINGRARIGADCAIHQVCTIGAGAGSAAPIVGDHVMFGAHSCVIGGVIVGDRVAIAAGAVVVKDVPSDCTVAGVPAKVVKMKQSPMPDDPSEQVRSEAARL